MWGRGARPSLPSATRLFVRLVTAVHFAIAGGGPHPRSCKPWYLGSNPCGRFFPMKMDAQTSPPPAQPGESDAFVVFGATGDLAYKQIFPALQQMIVRDNFNLP